MHHGAVDLLMRRADLHGLPGNRTRRPRPETPSVADLVNRDSPGTPAISRGSPASPNTPPSRARCTAPSSDTYSRRVAGWSIDTSPTAARATNALSMVIGNRHPQPGGNHHPLRSRRAVRVPGLHRTRPRLLSAALHEPGRGLRGQRADGVFRARVQVELPDRRRWRTRLELSTALSEYLEIFHNRQRRHSALEMLTPSSTSCAQHL